MNDPQGEGEEAELVSVHDLETRTTVRIPKAELSPGMVLAQVEGQDEPVYIDPAQTKLGDYQQEALSDHLLEEIPALAEKLSGVFDRSFDEWVDGFKRDQNPEREVAGWVHLADILGVMSKRHVYAPQEREECFRVLIACFTGARGTVRERSDPKILPSPQVDTIIEYFYEGGYE